MFRTNLRPLEYYHRYKHLDEFKSRCHDFYLLMCLWYLENDFVDEVYVWRLKPQIEYHRYEDVRDIVFNVAGKFFIQKFVSSFYECLDNPKYKEVKPTISFFRGGFPEYCAVTKRQPAFFGNSLYLGAGRRVYPQYGGRYRKLLAISWGSFWRRMRLRRAMATARLASACPTTCLSSSRTISRGVSSSRMGSSSTDWLGR